MKLSKYNLIRTLEDVETLDQVLMNGDKPRFDRIAIDTETNGLAHWKDVVVGISLSVDRNSGWYLPLLTWIPDTTIIKVKKGLKTYPEGRFQCLWSGEFFEESVNQTQYKAPEWVGVMLQRWLSSAQLIMHNAPFDCLMIEKNFGIDLSQKVFCDTQLLKHVLDENTSCGLKETAILWQKELGFSVEENANQEQLEMGASVVKNGGVYNKENKTIWRADLDVLAKYAIADTFLTYGVFEVGIEKFFSEYEEKHWNWFFEDEVMPVCREVVIPMKREGVMTDVEHFRELEIETRKKLDDLETKIINTLQEKKFLEDFSIGKSIDKAVSKKDLIEKIMSLEGLSYPTTISKGIEKKSLSKGAITKAYSSEPHWLWEYLLGQDEIRYSKEKLSSLKQELYETKTGKRFHFNIRSGQHLRWLFCKKLGNDPKKLPQTDSATKEKPIPKMDAEVLEEYFLPKYDFVKELLLFKKLDKLYGTYILPAVTLNHEGRLYMNMMQHGTISGRFSCGGGYNLQTLPKVEDVSRCRKCGSKNVVVANPIKLLAVMHCNDCEHLEEDILCQSAIKKGFIPPKGMRIVNADYSSLEPRCFAFMSSSPGLKEVYQKGLDFYSKIYCDMEDHEGRYSPDPKDPTFLKKVAPGLRDGTKPTALGIPYGARGPQVANLNNYRKLVTFRDGTEKEVLDVERGKAYIEKYLNTYPELRMYMDGQDAQANGRGFVETIIGRRRHFNFAPKVYKLLAASGIHHEEFLDERRKVLQAQDYKGYLDADGLRQLATQCGFNLFDPKKKVYKDWAFVRGMYSNELNNSKNIPIQGLGAHITNRAMLEMTREFRRLKLRAWVCLQVHDEITCYAADEDVEASIDVVRRCMEKNKYTEMLDVPMVAEPLVAMNLKEAK